MLTLDQTIQNIKLMLISKYLLHQYIYLPKTIFKATDLIVGIIRQNFKSIDRMFAAQCYIIITIAEIILLINWTKNKNSKHVN